MSHGHNSSLSIRDGVTRGMFALIACTSRARDVSFHERREEDVQPKSRFLSLGHMTALHVRLPRNHDTKSSS